MAVLRFRPGEVSGGPVVGAALPTMAVTPTVVLLAAGVALPMWMDCKAFGVSGAAAVDGLKCLWCEQRCYHDQPLLLVAWATLPMWQAYKACGMSDAVAVTSRCCLWRGRR